MITYEYPLNERIRTLLRLEDLFKRAYHFLEKGEPVEHHVALLTLFEILEVAGRADLKSELLQELERQKQMLLSLRNNPAIAEHVLKQVVSDIERASSAGTAKARRAAPTSRHGSLRCCLFATARRSY